MADAQFLPPQPQPRVDPDYRPVLGPVPADPLGIHFNSSTTSVSNRHNNPLVFSMISSDAGSDDVDMGDESPIPSFIDDGTIILPSTKLFGPNVDAYRREVS